MVSILFCICGYIGTIFLGYVCKQCGLANKPTAYTFAKIAYLFLLPCYILSRYQAFEFSWGLLCAFFLGITANMTLMLAAYTLSSAQNGRIRKDTMMILPGYSVFTFALPIISLFWPSEIHIYAAAFGYGNALMAFGGNFSFSSFASVSGQPISVSDLFKALFKSLPFDLCLILAVCFLRHLNIPAAADAFFSNASNACPFMIFFVTGLFLEPGMKKATWAYVLKLFLARLIINVLLGMLVYYLFPLDLEVRRCLMLCLASPMALSSLLFCAVRSSKGKIVSMSMLLSLIFSMLMMTILISIFSL